MGDGGDSGSLKGPRARQEALQSFKKRLLGARSLNQHHPCYPYCSTGAAANAKLTGHHMGKHNCASSGVATVEKDGDCDSAVAGDDRSDEEPSFAPCTTSIASAYQKCCLFLVA